MQGWGPCCGSRLFAMVALPAPQIHSTHTVNPKHLLDYHLPHATPACQACWQLLVKDSVSSLWGSATSVHVGIQQMEYGAQSAPHQTSIGPYTATGVSLGVAAGRLAFLFGLKGPAAAVDSACSSALVALHLGLQATRAAAAPGNALAAGVNLCLSPGTFAAAAAAGMLSPQARCKTLDASADGYVRWGKIMECRHDLRMCSHRSSSLHNVKENIVQMPSCRPTHWCTQKNRCTVHSCKLLHFS